MTGVCSSAGFVVACGRDGAIDLVLRGEVPGGAGGLRDLVDPGSLAKLTAFLAAIDVAGAAHGWELSVALDGKIVVLHFTGVAEGARRIVIASATRPDLAGLLGGLNALEGREAPGPTSRLDEMSAINNELVNMSREMAKLNLTLERAVAEHRRWIGVLAHDLRNPLGAISTYMEFILRSHGDDIGEKPRQIIEMMYRSSLYVNEMVAELLDLAAIESGQLNLTRGEVDLADLVRHVAMVVGMLAERKSIAVIAPAPVAPILVNLDSTKIEQVLTNLLGNAVKFTPIGGEVRIAIEDRANDVAIAVADNGQGIAPEDLGHLFRPFSRTATRPTGNETSTGLGLAICKRIVEGHGGDITVESRPGEGSVFTIVLPKTPPLA